MGHYDDCYRETAEDLENKWQKERKVRLQLTLMELQDKLKYIPVPSQWFMDQGVEYDEIGVCVMKLKRYVDLALNDLNR